MRFGLPFHGWQGRRPWSGIYSGATMAQIVIAMKPGELGHLNCSFGLMTGVQRLGHAVTYLAPASEEVAIRARGFGFRLLQTRLSSADFACDLFVADQTLPAAAVLALYHGYPCINLSTTLPPSREYSPAWSSRIPDDSLPYQAIRNMEALVDKLLVRPARVWREIRTGDGGPWSHKLPGISRDKRLVVALKRLKSMVTLVACPVEFQFRQLGSDGGRSNHIYIDPCVDFSRSSEPFESAWYPDGVVRICAALGSGSTATGARLSRLLLQTMRRRSDWSMVLATGGSVPLGDLGPIPANVHVANSIPQLAVLRHADLMITHCGLNSVKESICAGVPMVGLPIRRDQPSIGARIRDHELGAVTTPHLLGSRKLERVIDHVLSTPRYRENVQRMQRRFANSIEAQTGARLIHEIVRRAAAASDASPGIGAIPPSKPASSRRVGDDLAQSVTTGETLKI